MKISLAWIKEFTTIELDDDAIIKRIAAQIAEIEDIVDMSAWYTGVILGTIVEAGDHPDADKLGVYQVSIGDEEPVTVCAGDKTLQVGDRVGYIPPGCAVPQSVAVGDPFIIEIRTLRGVESNGMLGSAAELMIGDNHSGVLAIPAGQVSQADGTLFADVFNLNDTVIEVENKALTHRPDTFGVIGFAREVAGIQQIEFMSPDWLFNAGQQPITGPLLPLSVANNAPDSCHRFTAVAMSNVVIRKSPVIMQSYLHRLGVASINNVVDITNYLMLMTGQPLHAFDYDKVTAHSTDAAYLQVRYAKPAEKLKVLDGRELTLSSKNLVIATDKTALSVAGAIGGVDTEVDDDTKSIIIEVGNFDLFNLRKTSMQHGIFTDAVTRFIRGQDPAMCQPVSFYAQTLMSQYADAETASELCDVFPVPREQGRILISADRINQMLGTQYTSEHMATLLRNVELETSVQDNELAVVTPTWRPDLQIPEDIIEEVGRLHGYDSIIAQLPYRTLQAVSFSALEQEKRRMRNRLVAAGANEFLTYSFVPESLLAAVGIDPQTTYRIRNALRPELQRVRPSVLPSLLSQVYANTRRGFDEFAVFEIGKAHNNQEVVDQLPIEHQTVAFVYTSTKKDVARRSGAAYYTAQKYLRTLCGDVLEFHACGDENISSVFVASLARPFDLSRSAMVMLEGRIIGVVGEFSADTRRALKLPKYSAGFEISIEALAEIDSAYSDYAPLSKYPGITQDITFEVPADTSFSRLHAALRTAIHTNNEGYTITQHVVDIFAPNIETKRITCRLNFVRNDRTMKTSEASKLTRQAGDAVCIAVGARII